MVSLNFFSLFLDATVYRRKKKLQSNCLILTVQFYIFYIGGGLKEHTLEDVFSNLEEEMKEEAREVFVDSVDKGLLVKDCISEVYEKVKITSILNTTSLQASKMHKPETTTNDITVNTKDVGTSRNIFSGVCTLCCGKGLGECPNAL